MDEPVKITLDTKLENSLNFAYLREEGLTVIRRLASETWTDHNIHDPGITLLEAFSYALTEAGALSAMEMPDLLTSGKPYAPPEFFTAAQVLPSGPVSLSDFRKILLDHPLVNRAWISPVNSDPQGRMSILLEFEAYEGMDLNSNTISKSVEASPGSFYDVDIALPYWDEAAVLALQSNISLSAVDFEPAAVPLSPPASPVSAPLSPWQPIAGSDSYFARIKVSYLESGTTRFFEAWVVIKVTSPVPDPSTVLPQILHNTAVLLQLTDDNSILKQYNRRVTTAYETSNTVRKYLKNYRNLCETFTGFSAVRIQEIAFTARIEVAPNIKVETLLADIFFAVDNYVSPAIEPASLATLQKEGVETASIFDGPLPQYGFIGDQLLNSNLSLNKLYISDIVRLIIQLRTAGRTDIQFLEQLTNRSIIAVSNVSLSLYLDNRSITTGAKDCLQLINSTRFIPQLSPLKCRVTFVRNNQEIAYDINNAADIFEARRASARARNIIETPDLPLPNGVAYPVDEYYPVQNDLPINYGVGKAGLSQTVSTQRKAQAKQLKGYLFLFEQLIAGSFAQTAHINAIFSADPAVKTTSFQQPLYQIPAVSDLFLDPGSDAGFNNPWENFQQDENNAYRQVLDGKAEGEEQFLDRRHRMLDHLLARLGAEEEVKEMSDLAYRQSDTMPALLSPASPLTLPDTVPGQESHLETARQLIHDKADFYYDLPYLDHGRAQAAGLPYRRKAPFIQVQSLAGEFGWQIQDEAGYYLLRHAQLEKSEPEARRKAEEVMSLGTSVNFFIRVNESGGRFRIIARLSATSGPLAQSINTFGTPADADNAIQTIRQSMIRIWLTYSLAPLELRLQHLLRLVIKGERRKLISAVSDYFEIYDDPSLQKRFRLWNKPAPGSVVYLESAGAYPATAGVNAAVADTTRYGVFLEYYTVEQLPGGAFQINLHSSDGSAIAHSPNTYPDRQSAEDAKSRIRELIYRYYSLEGFYMVEHILLYPNSVPEGLVINDAVNVCQPLLSDRNNPYSFLISFVFPSGYARDFSLSSPPAQPDKTKTQPHRFRDPEFREYAERTIRKACPAHILPVVLWIDRDLKETPLPADAGNDFASFNHFEARYTNWLAAFFTDGAVETIIGPLRNNLVTILNKLHKETP